MRKNSSPHQDQSKKVALQRYHHRPFYDNETVKEWATFLIDVDGLDTYIDTDRPL